MRGWHFSLGNTDKRRAFRDGKDRLRGNDLDLFPVCSSTHLYSKAADLGPFEMSGHQSAHINTSIHLPNPNSFLMCKLHHHPTCSTVVRSDIRSSDSSAARVAVARACIIRGNQLSIMNKYSPTERQTYAPTDLSLSPAHHPATRGCVHILGPDKCDHNVSCTLGHACAKEPLCN